jgi:hypothetical protein
MTTPTFNPNRERTEDLAEIHSIERQIKPTRDVSSTLDVRKTLFEQHDSPYGRSTTHARYSRA